MDMTRKQIFVAMGVAVALLVFFFLYRQYADNMISSDVTGVEMRTPGSVRDVMVAPVPDSIDGMTADIEAEAALDLSSLDEEMAASVEEVNADSESVNNLGISYDENNF